MGVPLRDPPQHDDAEQLLRDRDEALRIAEESLALMRAMDARHRRETAVLRRLIRGEAILV